MRDCETCPLRNDFSPESNRYVGTPAQLWTITDEMHAELEAAKPNCPGWSLGRYIVGSVGLQLNMNVASAHEDPCYNPFRATKKYWSLRDDLIQAQDAAGLKQPSNITDHQKLRLDYLVAITRKETARRIEKKIEKSK